MVRPIDEKIVKMSLDAKRFNVDVKNTLRQFRNLNRGVNNVGAGNNLNNMAKDIGRIESRFSATGVVIGTVINQLTKQALKLGKNLTSAMLDPILEGGKKRAMNMEQAKFQFEGLGMDVEATMESALKAVKGTAFGLDEAAVVAASFGATGMRAGEEMTSALTGISGVAAMTGSSYSDVGNIFGKVAGQGRLMGSDLLRLSSRGINAAATLADQMDMTEQEVREMVTQGKISFDIFASAMNEAFGEHATKANETYTGSLSNLRAAFARIGAAKFGDNLKNSRDIFNTITPKVDDLFEAITPLIDAWNDFDNMKTGKIIDFINGIDFSGFVELGGITNIIDGLWNVMDGGLAILKAIRIAFVKIFPPDVTNTLVGLTEMFKNFTSGLVMSDRTAGKLTRVFEGVFAIFSIVWELTKHLGTALSQLIPEGIGGSVLDLLIPIADMIIEFNESIKAGNDLTDVIQSLGDVLGDFGRYIKNAIDNTRSFASGIKSNIGGAIDWVSEKLEPVAGYFKDAFGGMGSEELLGGGFLALVYLMFNKFMTLLVDITNVLSTAKSNMTRIGRSLEGLFLQVGGALREFQNSVKYATLLMTAIAIGILALSLKAMEGIDGADIAKGIAALAGSMAVLAAGMSAINMLNFTGGLRASVTIIALAVAINIMAGALKKMSSINLKEMAVSIGGLVGVVTALSIAIIAISKFGGKIKASSVTLIALSGAIYILASAVEKMSSIDTGSLFKSIGALALIFAALAAFLKVANGSKFGMGSALGVLALSAAILVMTEGIERIAGIDVPTLAKGLVTIGLILTQIAIFSKIAKGPSLMASGVGLLLIAGAINALVPPIQTFSEMSWTELAKGLGAMAIALVAVAGAAMLMSGSMLGALGLVAMATGLTMLAVPIQIFANMTWGQLIKGFVGLAGGMAVVAGAAMLLTPAIPSMLGFGVALLAVGVAMLAAGAGVGLFGAGLMTLATLTATSIAAIISALGLLIKGLGSLIVGIVDFVVDLGVALLTGLVDLIGPAVDVVVELVMAILNAIMENLPKFLEKGWEMVLELMAGIEEYVPQLVDTGQKMMITLINGLADSIAENGPEMTDAMVRLMGEVILVVIDAGVSMINALFGWMPGVKDATAEIGGTAEKYIRDNFGAKGAGQDKGDEFASGMKGRKRAAGRSAGVLADEAEDGLDVDMSGSGKDFGSGFASGMRSQSTINKVASAGRRIASAAASTVRGWLDMRSPSRVMIKDGGFFGEGFAIGIGDKAKEVGDKAKTLAMTAKDTLNKFIDGFTPGPDDEEIHFKAVIDYDGFDPDIPIGSIPVRGVPDTSFTNGMFGSTRNQYRQNGYNLNREGQQTSGDNVNHNYDIHIEGNGTMTRAQRRKLAEDIQAEIKNINDRGKISRGEEVLF